MTWEISGSSKKPSVSPRMQWQPISSLEVQHRGYGKGYVGEPSSLREGEKGEVSINTSSAFESSCREHCTLLERWLAASLLIPWLTQEKTN